MAIYQLAGEFNPFMFIVIDIYKLSFCHLTLCFLLLFISFFFASSFSCTTLLETWRGERTVLLLLEKGGVDMSRKTGNLLHAVQVTQN